VVEPATLAGDGAAINYCELPELDGSGKQAITYSKVIILIIDIYRCLLSTSFPSLEETDAAMLRLIQAREFSANCLFFYYYKYIEKIRP